VSDHSGHRQRLKNALRDGGILGFAPHEVTELMLYSALPRRDVNDLAHALTENCGGVTGVMSAEKSALVNAGAGEKTAEILAAFAQCVNSCRKGVEGRFIRTRGELDVLLNEMSQWGKPAFAILSSGKELLFWDVLPEKNPIGYVLQRMLTYDGVTCIMAGKTECAAELKTSLETIDATIEMFKQE